MNETRLDARLAFRQSLTSRSYASSTLLRFKFSMLQCFYSVSIGKKTNDTARFSAVLKTNINKNL